jgi:hypothetical protein
MMIPGSGSDVFAFASGLGGSTIISGFVEGRDYIALQGYQPGTLPSAAFVRGNIQLTLSDNTRITVLGLNHLATADFL